MKKFVIALMLSLCGCMSAYKGGTVSDGTSLVIGLKTPITSTGTTTLQILSYVNGLIVSFESNVNVELKRTQSETLSAFGIWNSSKTNTTEMTLCQVEDSSNERQQKKSPLEIEIQITDSTNEVYEVKK